MLASVYPVAVRSIAGDVDTQFIRRKGGYSRSLWTLNISGKFCLWPRRRNSSDAYQRAEVLSGILALPVSCHTKNVVVSIRVQIPQSYLDRVIQKVYRKETEA